MDRLLATVLLLQGHRCVTAEAIAKHFEISVRTVYRDITALGEAGVPIVAEAGVGYSLMKGYHLPPVMFSREEAYALVTGGILVEGMTDPAMRADMESALLKIRALLPSEQQDSLVRLASHTGLFQMAQKQPKYRVGIPEVQRALVELRVIHIRYRAGSTGAVTNRSLEPVGLVHYLDRWHLLAWCRLREDYRDFRLDRILSYEVTDERHERRSDKDAADFLCDWTEKESRQYIRFKFTRWAADRVEREWPLAITDRLETSDGVEMTLATGEFEWLAGWLLSLGKGVEVLDSPELQHFICKRAQEMVEHHGKSFS